MKIIIIIILIQAICKTNRVPSLLMKLAKDFSERNKKNCIHGIKEGPESRLTEHRNRASLFDSPPETAQEPI